MLSAVLGLFSQDLAVDLGTTNTRLYMRGSGMVCDEPTVLAVHTDARGRRQVLAVGAAARDMLGRTPGDIETVQPIRDGQIRDYEVAEALLVHLVRRVQGRKGLVGPRMVIALPHGATEMERRAVRESCESTGAREVHLVPRPLAAALGAELPVGEASGHLLIDVGGGATEVSILSFNGVVSSVAVQGGGDAMDDAIVAFLRDRYDLLVGRPTAERLKVDIGTARPDAPVERRSIAGRCLTRGIPRAVEIGSDELQQALSLRVAEIGRAVRHVIERAPPELASDIVDHGIVLCGGGSLLRGLDVALRDITGLPVVRSEDPVHAVIEGTGRILEELELFKLVAS
jgi:rod shape-determining protein MreB